MNSFSSKYPAFASLLSMVALFAQDLAVQGESLVQKLEGAVNLVGPVVAFLPQANLLGPEMSQLKSSPSDIELAAETLVTDLSFTSDKAKAVIAAAFPVGESLAGLVPQVEVLVAAIKS